MENIQYIKENNMSEREAKLRTMKVLKYWEDADFFDLKVKKKVADDIVKEVKNCFEPPERRL